MQTKIRINNISVEWIVWAVLLVIPCNNDRRRDVAHERNPRWPDNEREIERGESSVLLEGRDIGQVVHAPDEVDGDVEAELGEADNDGHEEVHEGRPGEPSIVLIFVWEI